MTVQEKEDWLMIIYRMRSEGFHYCWKHYSNFEEIKDNEFHKLRKKYIKAADALQKYIDKQEELSDDE